MKKKIFITGSTTGLGLLAGELTVSHDPEALVSGKYFHHKREHQYNSQADSDKAQDDLIIYLKKISGTGP